MNLKQILLILLVLLSLATTSRADRLEQLFEQANQAYEKEDYTTAIKSYSDIINYGVENSAVFFNLGNAYIKTRQVGQAILYYEKAHRLVPRDPDVLANLELAQLMTVDKVDMPVPGLTANLVNHFYNYFSLNELAELTLFHFAGIMGLLCIIVLVRSNEARRILWYFAGFGIALLLLFGLTFYTKQNKQEKIAEAIVLTPKLDAYSQPGATGAISFTVHEGKKVLIRQSRDNWAEVELENGWQGWVQDTKLGKI